MEEEVVDILDEVRNAVKQKVHIFLVVSHAIGRAKGLNGPTEATKLRDDGGLVFRGVVETELLKTVHCIQLDVDTGVAQLVQGILNRDSRPVVADCYRVKLTVVTNHAT